LDDGVAVFRPVVASDTLVEVGHLVAPGEGQGLLVPSSNI
jgi:hypothetical protein